MPWILLVFLLLGCEKSIDAPIGGSEEDWESGEWTLVGPDAGGKAVQDSTPYNPGDCVEYPDIPGPSNRFTNGAALFTVNSLTCFYSKSRIYSNGKPIRFLFYEFGYAGELAKFPPGQAFYILEWDEKDENGKQLSGVYEWRVIITYGNRVTKKYKGNWKV